MRRIMMGCLVLVTFTGAASSAGCKGCRDVEKTFEVEYGSVWYDIQKKMVDDYVKLGFDCSNSEAIRNAFGQTIGRKYTCTKCE